MAKPITRIVTVAKTERTQVDRVSSNAAGRWEHDFFLYFDAEFVAAFGTQNDAEHAGAMLVEDEARKVAA